MFIIGGEPEELVVKEGNSTKVIIPASEECLWQTKNVTFGN
ncbi:hypothetical protein [Parageobacillus thermoglucosidasius]|nr:hypothetical protein [Parageobacillus thermoglucosidasius]